MVKIIAHRGAWKEFDLPQNSLASCRKAMEMQCYGSEFDIQRTKDNQLIVFHDDEIDGQSIESCHWNQIKSKRLSNGEQIPLLKDFLLLKKSYSYTKLIAEIKPSLQNPNFGIQTTHEVAHCVRNYHLLPSQIEFILFDWGMCLEMKKLLPAYRVSYLNGDKSPEEIAQAGLDGLDYNYSILLRTTDILHRANQLHLLTNSWTVNEWSEAQSLIQNHLQHLTTDFPFSFIENNKSDY